MMTTIYSKDGTDAAIGEAVAAIPAPDLSGYSPTTHDHAGDYDPAGTAAGLRDELAVDQITLSGPLVLTVPAGFPAGQVYRCALTQDGTGGHTVTYGGAAVTVDTAPNAVTTVELHPTGGGWVIAYPVTASEHALTRSGSSIARQVAAKLTGVKVVLIMRHDDLQSSVWDYLPIYEAHGVRATFYVVPAYVGTGGHLTEAQLLEIYARGHDIGSHGMNHRQADALILTESERRAELADSKAWIESTLGAGCVCETTAYPGNIPVYDGEVFDYYLAGMADAGTPALYGPVNLKRHPASFADLDWIDDASSAANIAKITARLATLKAQTDGAVDVIQAHNTTEMTATQLDELLTVVDADPEVAILTASEWVHYVRERYQSPNGAHFHCGPRQGVAPVQWKSPVFASGAFIADRLDQGACFRALVNGVEKASLDSVLVLGAAGQSRLEKGHQLLLYDESNTTYATIRHEGGNYLTLATGDNAGTILQRGTVQIRRDGAGFAVQSSAAETAFEVDTTKQTMRLRSLGSTPATAAVVGEMCVVNGVLNICTVAGTPGTWVAVGSQT